MIKKRLGDIVNFKRGYDLPSYMRTDGKYPVISSGGISGYHAEFKAEGEGVVTGRYGTLGEVYYVNGKYWPHNTALYVTDFKGNYPKYVYFLLKNLGNLKTSDKSTVPGVNRNDLHELAVPYIMNPEHQKLIADCLFQIEEKIDLNNSTCAALETLAKTIYDYWFVQFDFPNRQGKPYKSSGGEMIYNPELKHSVPADWGIGRLSDIAHITMGQSPPGSSYNESGEGIVFFQGCTDFGERFPVIRQYTTKPARFASKGDILLSVRAPVGELNLARENCCIGRGLSALHSKDNSASYLFNVMQNFKQIFERRNGEGTTFGAITKDDLHSLKVIKPSPDILAMYDKVVSPMFEQQNIVSAENQLLVEARDWLLPMLMNGQVMVNTKVPAI